MSEMFWEVEWEQIKRTIEDWVRDYVRGQTPPEGGC